MNREAMGSLILVALLLGGCQTNVKFANMIPGAWLENVRWEPTSSENIYAAPGPLRTGSTSIAVNIFPGDQDEQGPVSFELVVEGSRIALTTHHAWTAELNETTTITLNQDTEVFNPWLRSGELAALDPAVCARLRGGAEGCGHQETAKP